MDGQGAPVAGASVAAWSAPSEVVVTGPEGRFSLPGREAGYLLLHAWSEGLVPDDARLAAYAGSEVRLVLVPGCPVRVTVKRAIDASPVAGARLRTLCGEQTTDDVDFAREACFTSEGVTGDDGVVVLSAREGMTRFHVAARGCAPVSTAPAYVPVEGAVAEVVVAPGGTIAGRTVDGEGHAFPGAEVHVVCGAVFDMRVRSGDDGTFRLDDVPTADIAEESRWNERVYASARAPGHAPVAVQAERPTVGGERVIELRLVAGRTLEGVVLDGLRRPVADAKVYGEPGHVSWQGAERLATAPHLASSDAAGRFLFLHVAPGSLDVRAYKQRPKYYATLEVQIRSDGEMPVVELVEDRTRGDAGLVVRVVDVEGRAVTDACVDAEDPARTRGDGHIVRACVDAEGRASIEGLPAAPLRLTVVSDRFPEHEVLVDLSAFPLEEVLIRMPPGRAEGRVLLTDGSPARVEVVLRCPVEGDEHDWSGWPFLKTDAEGRVVFEGLDARTFGIGLSTNGLTLRNGPRTFRAGDRCVWTVVRESDSPPPIAVELVDADSGSPVEDAEVAFRLGIWVATEPVEGHPGWFACEGPVEVGPVDVRVHRLGRLDVVLPGIVIGGMGPPTRVRVPIDIGAVLTGQVLGMDGVPMEDVELAMGGQVGSSEEDGRYRLAGLADGEALLELSGVYVVPTSRRVRVSRAEPTTLEVRVVVAGGIAFSTSDPESVREPVSIVVRTPDGAEVQRISVAPGEFYVRQGQPAWLGEAASLVPGRYVVECVSGTSSKRSEVEVQAGRMVDVDCTFPTRPPR